MLLIVRHTATFITNACNDGQHDEVPDSVIGILTNPADSSRYTRYLMHTSEYHQAQKHTLSTIIILGVAQVSAQYGQDSWQSNCALYQINPDSSMRYRIPYAVTDRTKVRPLGHVNIRSQESGGHMRSPWLSSRFPCKLHTRFTTAAPPPIKHPKHPTSLISPAFRRRHPQGNVRSSSRPQSQHSNRSTKSLHVPHVNAITGAKKTGLEFLPPIPRLGPSNRKAQVRSRIQTFIPPDPSRATQPNTCQMYAVRTQQDTCAHRRRTSRSARVIAASNSDDVCQELPSERVARTDLGISAKSRVPSSLSTGLQSMKNSSERT